MEREKSGPVWIQEGFLLKRSGLKEKRPLWRRRRRDQRRRFWHQRFWKVDPLNFWVPQWCENYHILLFSSFFKFPTLLVSSLSPDSVWTASWLQTDSPAVPGSNSSPGTLTSTTRGRSQEYFFSKKVLIFWDEIKFFLYIHRVAQSHDLPSCAAAAAPFISHCQRWLRTTTNDINF